MAHSRRLAWLALLAVGLLALMPTLSRLRAAPMQLPPPMALGWCQGHLTGADSHPAMGEGDLLSACGYCSVFCHSPLLWLAVAALLLIALAYRTAPRALPRLPLLQRISLLRPPTRGPPAFA